MDERLTRMLVRARHGEAGRTVHLALLPGGSELAVGVAGTCGVVTDRTGTWRLRNIRRHGDPAGLRRTRMPQPFRTPVVAGTVPYPGARHHRRSHPGGSA